MKPGRFELEVCIAGFRLTCMRCQARLYFAEASQPKIYDAGRLLRIAAEHECPNLKERAA